MPYPYLLVNDYQYPLDRNSSGLRLAIFFLVALIGSACGENKNNSSPKKRDTLQESLSLFDTSNTSLIPLTKTDGYTFDKTYKQSELNKTDFIRIDSLLIVAVADFNKKMPYKHFFINLKTTNYKKQLVAATNSKGEKEVWVNCMCSVSDSRWKTEILVVKDGGNCFFNCKINLTTKTYHDFTVNGDA